MPSNRVTLQLLAFLALTGGVAANVFFMQASERRGHGGQPSATEAWNIAAIEAAEFGDTGSIGHPAPANAQGLDLAALAAGGAPTKAASQQEVTRAVQRELQIRGYETGARDGVAGVMTRGAIMAYEHDHGLALTARPSQELLKAIVLGEAGKGKGVKAETAEAQDVIRSVQRSLAKLRYKPGPANGRLTPETARAIRAFEGDQALPETGRVSGPLISRLARLSGDGRVASAP
jgi:peptidoglycan hydrolase-like protein with peptidoglycan-binding domain